MRLYLLDKMACPKCGSHPFALAVEKKTNVPVSGDGTQPCVNYCAYYDKPLSKKDGNLPCGKCLGEEVLKGQLECKVCNVRYAISDGIPNLLENSLVSDLEKNENQFWGGIYQRTDHEAANTQEQINLYTHRQIERNQHIFTLLRKNEIKGGTLLEIGSGRSQYIAAGLPPDTHRYFYVATDISHEALLQGKKLLPIGDYIRCTVDALPFSPGQFDTALSLGVLYLSPSSLRAIPLLAKMVKPRGLFIFDEPVLKPKLLRALRVGLGRSFGSAQLRDGRLTLEGLRDTLQLIGEEVLWHEKMSPFRVAALSIGERFLKNRMALRILLAIDQAVVRTLGRMIPSLGGAEVLTVYRIK
jgi:uncharacterized protein YbaR (Trm112 family)/SAM-dependent methyltransferase